MDILTTYLLSLDKFSYKYWTLRVKISFDFFTAILEVLLFQSSGLGFYFLEFLQPEPYANKASFKKSLIAWFDLKKISISELGKV